MGTKRVGLARTAALIENLKRSIDWNGSTFTDCNLTSPGVTVKSYTIDNTDDAQTITMTTTDYKPGSVIYVEAGGNNKDINITLPPKSEGLNYTFICTGNAHGSTHFALTSSANGDVLNAYMISSDTSTDNVWNTSAARTIEFSDGQFKQGTRLDMQADGNNWYIHGRMQTTTGSLNSTSS